MTPPERHEMFASSAKLGSLWAAVGVSSWSDLATLLAAIYSLLLIADFTWKKAIKPMLWRLGWLRRPRRRASDFMSLDDTSHGKW